MNYKEYVEIKKENLKHDGKDENVNIKYEEFKSIKRKTFKQLVETISRAKTEQELNRAAADVDFSYQHDGITWKDNEMLYDLIGTAFKAYVKGY